MRFSEDTARTRGFDTPSLIPSFPHSLCCVLASPLTWPLFRLARANGAFQLETNASTQLEGKQWQQWYSLELRVNWVHNVLFISLPIDLYDGQSGSAGAPLCVCWVCLSPPDAFRTCRLKYQNKLRTNYINLGTGRKALNIYGILLASLLLLAHLSWDINIGLLFYLKCTRSSTPTLSWLTTTNWTGVWTSVHLSITHLGIWS